MEITGSVICITGASSGIGESTARLAHAQGAIVVLLARRADRLHALAESLPGSITIPVDVTDQSALTEALTNVASKTGRIDVLVNNAGQGLHVPVSDIDPDDFRAILELNTVAPLVAMQAVAPVMKAQHAGTIINVSSGTSKMVLPGVGAYAASKAALNMLSSVARTEWAEEGITVSTLFPFVTNTEFHTSLRDGAVADPGPTGYVAHSADDVAAALLELIRSGAEETVLIPGQVRAAQKSAE